MGELSDKKKRKRRSPFTKRLLSQDATSTHLWVPDKRLFDEITKKRRTTPSELLRDIVHQWALTKKLARDTKEGQQKIDLINLQRETKEKVDELSTLIERLVQIPSSPDESFAT